MKNFLAYCMLTFPLWMHAQNTKQAVGNYNFKITNSIDAQPIQNQYRTGTCWSFSALSFIESEVKRQKGIDVKLSEMWVVRNTYIAKAERYVRMHGHVNMAQGGAFHDVIAMIDKHGIVPQSEYKGLDYGTEKHIHSELEAVIKAMCDAIISNKNGQLSASWKDAITATVDAYLGAPVERFDYKGKSYTPESFADYLAIDEDDYIALTSFTHQEMYDDFVIELPDNWMHEEVDNIPLDEFMEVMRSAVKEGYSFAWGADVSEKGFSHRNGVAVMPEGGFDNLTRAQADSVVKHPGKQMQYTAALRQEGYDNYSTTDDHGMHIMGYAEETNTGEMYFLVKNSWGLKSNECDGYFYASESYVAMKTINILIHKDAVPKKILKKLD